MKISTISRSGALNLGNIYWISDSMATENFSKEVVLVD